MNKEEILKAMRYRSAIRFYDVNRMVAREDMEYILEAARLSPSSIGLEAWRFICVADKAFMQEMKQTGWGMNHQADTASYFVVLVARKDVRYDSALVYESLKRRGLSPEKIEKSIERYEQFQREDMDIADHPRALFDWSAKQTYIAMGNMMTAAAMIGIDTCPIEGFHYASLNQLLSKKGLINEEIEGVTALLSVGYRVKDPSLPKQRKDPRDVFTWVE